MAAGEEIRIRIRGIQYPPQLSADRPREGRGRTHISTTVENPEPVVTVQEVTASYFCRAGAHYLLYEEQPEGFDRTFKTRVKRRGNHLEIDRQGPVGSNMVFEPGKTWRTEYGTLFGKLPLDIVTETLEVMQDESSVKGASADMPHGDAETWQDVKIRYILKNQGEALGEYELYIERI